MCDVIEVIGDDAPTKTPFLSLKMQQTIDYYG
jgi:hypothetical protein